MAGIRRARGFLLRLVRRRGVAIAAGVALGAPALAIELLGRDVAWWLQGISLIAGATGIALVWTGLTGIPPDWVE
jgi:hypothetical protein